MKPESSALSLGIKFVLGYVLFIALEIIFLLCVLGINQPGGGDLVAFILMLVVLPLDLLVLIVFVVVYIFVAGRASKNKFGKMFSWLFLICVFIFVYGIWDSTRSLNHPAKGFLIPMERSMPGYIKKSENYSKVQYKIWYVLAQNQSLAPVYFQEEKGMGECKRIMTSVAPHYFQYTHFNYNGSNGVVMKDNRNDYWLYYNDKGSCLQITNNYGNSNFKSPQDFINILKTMNRS